MIAFFALMVVVALIIAAIWWKPGKTPKGVSRVSSFASFAEPVALKPQLSQRDQVLDEEIEMIANLIRQDEFDRRRKSAMERLESLKVPK
jgi:hypothetical protein